MLSIALLALDPAPWRTRAPPRRHGARATVRLPCPEGAKEQTIDERVALVIAWLGYKHTFQIEISVYLQSVGGLITFSFLGAI
jgi:hypothetical protein